ncbi:ATP-binding cassette domain-containing protein [Paenibacillus ferrarius]|uniref:ATP-binding cassette domain-containing protein n=1 Tax=Paenibacillus ferrarius TaxID=1469647 RepID=UPI003D27CC4C
MSITENPYMVELKAIHKKYLLKHAVKGIDLHIRKGTIVGLLGPNGSGKSTLLKMLAGLIYPTSGSILVGGKKPDVHNKQHSPRSRRSCCLPIR